jgi:nitrite reductase/ring-hydroxylating ferredoxin subunit
VFSLARTTDLKPGEMRAFEVADKKVLVLRTSEGEWQAFNLECPHAGAPLDQGALCGDRIICPWHKSCFAAADGALLSRLLWRLSPNIHWSLLAMKFGSIRNGLFNGTGRRKQRKPSQIKALSFSAEEPRLLLRFRNGVPWASPEGSLW